MRETPAAASSSISPSAVGAVERFQLNDAIRSGRGSKPTASQSPAAAIHAASFSGSSISAREISLDHDNEPESKIAVISHHMNEIANFYNFVLGKSTFPRPHVL
jgi:hypothetical protein